MDGMLSQEEINALLGNVDADSTSEEQHRMPYRHQAIFRKPRS